MTDRYAWTGSAIPRIYPGTLEGLGEVRKDAINASRVLPNPQIISKVEDGIRTVIAVFQHGEETVPQDTQEDE